MPTPDIIDARGLKCPMPVLKLEKQLENTPGGATLIVLADDPVARIDIPFLCKKNGHTCIIENDGAAMRFIITKNAT